MRSGSAGGDVEFGQQVPDAGFDVVADRAHGSDVVTGGIFELPFTRPANWS
ncbi:hypothetical protein [Nocardia fluminea]|uniref:hypothetical protein n=1 Tax=Nocardia fluminea TaxID=134984 RepID=UPI00365EA86E